MPDSQRALSDHPKAVIRRELRLAIREPEFDADAAERVVLLLARGIGLTAIGDLAGYPAYATVNFWRARYPEFDEACVLASEAGADALAWENVAIADDDTRSPANKALSIQVRDRLSRVLHRKKYDPAVKVEVAASAGKADDLSDAELAAIVRRRARGAAVTVTDITQGEDDDGQRVGDSG